MADKPYQKKVDEFLAGYRDKFLPSLVTGKGTDYRPPVDPVGQKMDAKQAQLERDKMLATSIHPDTFGRILDVMSGKGIPASPFTNLGGPEPSHRVQPGTPMSQFSNTPEGQAIMRERAIPIPHVSAGFGPQPVGGTLEEFKTAIPLEFARGGKVTPGPIGVPGAEKPIPGGETYFQYTKPDGSLGFTDREEAIPAGATGITTRRFEDTGRGIFGGVPSVSDAGGPAIPASYLGETGRVRNTIKDQYGNIIGETMVPSQGGAGAQGYEMPEEIRTAIGDIQRILMKPSPSVDVPSPGGNIRFAGGYGKAHRDALVSLGGVFAKMAETEAEKPYRKGMIDYYSRMAGAKEAELPSDIAYKRAMGEQALKESLRPWMMAAGTSYQDAQGKWVTAPEKSEPVRAVIQDVYKRNFTPNPMTGEVPGVRGVKAELRSMRRTMPELRDLPKEAYKETKAEFMEAHKKWLEGLDKKERKAYEKKRKGEDLGKLYKEYWEQD